MTGCKNGYYSVSQAAAQLGVSRISIWRWIRDGYLPATRLGPRTTRIKCEDVDRAIGQFQSDGSRSRLAGHLAATTAIRDSTSTLPSLLPTGLPACHHAVQFYEDDAFLVETVVEYVGASLRAGGAGIVVATRLHRHGIETRLVEAGFDLSAAISAGHYVALDAEQSLSRIMIAAEPNAERFVHEMGNVVARAAQGEREVRIFGEMVALLAVEGNYRGAVQLEDFWNELLRGDRFSLLCAYPIGRLGGDTLTEVLSDICASHSNIIPAESYTQRSTESERLQAIVALQQKAHWLQTQIAARERAEVELRFALSAGQDALKEAIESQRKRDELVSVAAQELKHPLYSLSLQAQHALLRLGRETHLSPERVKRAVEAVTGQPGEIPRLIGHVVELSRIEAGKLSLLPQWADLTSLVEQVVEDMRGRGNRHTITLAAPSSLEVRIDPERMEKVLINLIDNAIRHNPDGGTIEIALTHSLSIGARLSVWDRGQGIPADKRGALFELDDVDDILANQGQVGVGLFISRQIVELHGGELYAEFPAGGGSRFVMSLPVGLNDPTAHAAAD